MRVAEHAERLKSAADGIAWLDTVSALAEVAIERDYVRPSLNQGTRIEVISGRHPVLETVLATGEYVPNHTLLDAGSDQLIILTGPNMAGKSSWLRQVALITLMAQIGIVRACRVGLDWIG